jgi:hypothetical protein
MHHPASPTDLEAARGGDTGALARLLGTERSGRELLAALAAEAGRSDADQFIHDGAQLLDRLRERDVILGCLPAADPPTTGTPPCIA